MREEVKILLKLLFVGHGNLRYANSQWHEENCTGYHSYRIAHSPNLPSAIVSAHRESIAVGSENHALSFLKDLNQQHRDSDRDALIRAMCKRWSDIEGKSQSCPGSC